MHIHIRLSNMEYIHDTFICVVVNVYQPSSKQLLCILDHTSGSSRCLNEMSSYTSDGHVSRVRVKDARSQIQTRRNVAKMLIAVVVMFGVCFLPVHLLNILRSTSVSTILQRVTLLTLWLY